jgi:hypothetical protein
MARLVKHGSQGVADAPTGGEAKDAFDLSGDKKQVPEVMPVSAMDLGSNTSLYDKEAVGKDVLPPDANQKETGQDIEGTPFKSFVESPKGKILPIEKSGDPATPVEDADLERFANQGTPDYQGAKDNLDAEEELKKAVGHKTHSGL